MAPGAMADSFSTPPRKSFHFSAQRLFIFRDNIFQRQIYGPDLSAQIALSRVNEGDGMGIALAAAPARASVPEPATLALVGTGFVCLGLGLRSLRSKRKFEN